MVDAVYDDEEGLAYAQSQQYDGIVLDIMMPGMNAQEVLHKGREPGCNTSVLLFYSHVTILMNFSINFDAIIRYFISDTL